MTSSAFIQETEKYPTRVMVHGLPPEMTESKLLEILKPRPECKHFYFVKFKIEDGLFKLPRAYMNFGTHEGFLKFIKEFGYKTIPGNNGVKYKMIVEAAPNQRLIVSKRKKVDQKMGTVEQDKYYQYFMHKLQTKERCSNSYINYDFYSKKNDTHKMTPLLTYVMERKSRKDLKTKSDGIVFVNSTKKKNKNRLNRDYKIM